MFVPAQPVLPVSLEGGGEAATRHIRGEEQQQQPHSGHGRVHVSWESQIYMGHNVMIVKGPCSCPNFSNFGELCSKTDHDNFFPKTYLNFLRLCLSENVNNGVLSLVKLV